MKPSVPLHIAVGVINDGHGRILVSQRQAACTYAGQWEFPGGKLEAGEDVQAALQRELQEELGIAVHSARPLIRITHRYPDRHVLLDTWRVDKFEGHAHGREGQQIRWLQPEQLDAMPMLAANRPIVRAAQLPDRYLITPEPGRDVAAFLRQLEAALQGGIRLLRLRANTLDDAAYEQLARQVLRCCRPFNARLLLDRSASMVTRLAAHGRHLRSGALRHTLASDRPAGLLAVSCHNADELSLALALGADFAVLGAVAATASHPDAPPLGWPGFAALADQAGLPVYALGGMRVPDIGAAWQHGGQGIAAIRGLWPTAA